MKRLIPVIAVVLLIVALIFVNKSISKTAHPDDDDDDNTTQTVSKTKPSTPTPPATDAGDALQPEQTLGNPAKAKYRITVGWVYDESNQTNPQALISALKAIQEDVEQSGGMASAEIVDLDVPPSDLSPAAAAVSNLGVMVNGKPVGPSIDPGEGVLTGEYMAHMLAVH